MRKATVGYLSNLSKTCLVVKLKHLPVAETGVTITVQGHRYLGAVLGSRSFVDKLEKKATSWTLKIWRFLDNTKVHPQAAMQLLRMLMAWYFAQERGQTTIDSGVQSNVLYLRVAIQHSDLYAEVRTYYFSDNISTAGSASFHRALALTWHILDVV